MLSNGMIKSSPIAGAGGGGGLSNLVEDLTPQLGGDLDLNGKNLDFPTTANISDVLDEDNMASNSATALCTQQSIKAYADSLVAGASTTLNNLGVVAINTSLVSDTDITDDLGTGDIRWKDAWVETLNSGLTDTDTLKLRGRDIDGAAYVDILTITSANTVTADLHSSVTLSGSTIASSDNTVTFTNKTFDANGTGNSLSNVDVADLANGTDGELITWDASGNPATVAVGTATHVLTSNGAGAAPTFQAAAGGSANFWNDSGETDAWVSATSFKISGQDETAKFYPGRGMKFTQTSVNSGNPFYGFVVSSSFSTDTTITVFATHDLANETLDVDICNERIPVIQYGDNLTLATDTSNAVGRFYTREGGTAIGCRMQVQTAPTGSAAIMDLHIGGTSDYTTATNCQVAASGTDSGHDRGDLTTFAGGTEIEFFCDQKGSTVAGAAPNYEFFYVPDAWQNLT